MTWRKYYDRRYDRHRRTYVDTYLKHGHWSASWEDAVNKMLGDYALFRRENTDIEFRRQMLDKVDQILNLECDDPRIISIKGILLFNIKSSVDAAPFLLKGFEMPDKSGYPRRYFFFAASHLCLVYGNRQGQANPWQQYHQAKMKYLGQVETYGLLSINNMAPIPRPAIGNTAPASVFSLMSAAVASMTTPWPGEPSV